MLILSVQVVVLLTAILLPLHTNAKKRKYNIDTDTSASTYAINDSGKLERLKRLDVSDNNPRIQN